MDQNLVFFGKYITRHSKNSDDINLVKTYNSRGYELHQIVPMFLSDGSCYSYSYWFKWVGEDVSIKDE